MYQQVASYNNSGINETLVQQKIKDVVFKKKNLAWGNPLNARLLLVSHYPVGY